MVRRNMPLETKMLGEEYVADFSERISDARGDFIRVGEKLNATKRILVKVFLNEFFSDNFSGIQYVARNLSL